MKSIAAIYALMLCEYIRITYVRMRWVQSNGRGVWLHTAALAVLMAAAVAMTITAIYLEAR